MYSPLNLPTDTGKTVAELVFSEIDAAAISPVVVDVGARNGMFLLPESYTGRATIMGFEPNPEEFAKLAEHRSDAERILSQQGVKMPRFKHERFFDCAVWDQEETRPLYVTAGAGACTMLGETKPFMKNVYYRYPEGDPRRQVSFHDLQSRVVREVPVKCRPLDAVLFDVAKIDFLKLDVEGGELHVLRGARRLLSEHKVLFVRTEFAAFSYYEDHTLFGDQHRFLTDQGFRLLEIAQDHPRYRRGVTDLPDACDRGLLFAGDALFALDPDRIQLTPLELHRLAAISLAFRFNSFALSLLHDAGLLSPDELASVTRALRRRPPRSWQRLLLETWVSLPYTLYGASRSILARLKNPLA